MKLGEGLAEEFATDPSRMIQLQLVNTSPMGTRLSDGGKVSLIRLGSSRAAIANHLGLPFRERVLG